MIMSAAFLRPAALKQARTDFQSGAIDAEALKAVEDGAIRDLVAKQKAAGYHVITDGEFRRATWHLDFMWGFNGVGHSPTKTGLPFHGEAAMLDDTYLTGKVIARLPSIRGALQVRQRRLRTRIPLQSSPFPPQHSSSSR